MCAGRTGDLYRGCRSAGVTDGALVPATAPATRIAPTPSGFLHMGNAANALLVHWLARNRRAGQPWAVTLRIDDVDHGRVRPEYVEDIFNVLSWLGIQWTNGPASAADYLRGAARPGGMTPRPALDAERDIALSLRDGAPSGIRAFVCGCSRREVLQAGITGCPADCASRNLQLRSGETALRLRIPAGLSEPMDGCAIDLSVEHPDVVIWRRDDLPAYHLATVLDDERIGTTHIVRGADLRSASALQVVLARALGATGVAGATYLHHELLTDQLGRKISKSTLRAGNPMARDPALAARITTLAMNLGEPLGISPSTTI